jgi:uncharacterized protein (TIGR03435 family)
LTLTAPGLSQTKDSLLSFEVASIKPSGNGAALRSAGEFHPGTTVSGRSVDIRLASLQSLIETAYHVESYQVTGPDWMAITRFDILANMPEGAKREQIPEMLQSLLVERFHLTAHREFRERTVYTLAVGRNGPRMKEAAPQASPSDKPFPNGADGRRLLELINSEDGRAWTIAGWKGRTVFEASKISMPEFAKVLMRYVDGPVIDGTGIAGYYEVACDVPPRPLARGNGARGGLGQDATDPGPDGLIFDAVQSLGLKLEKRRAPLEQLVVDRLEKAPTEN